MNDFVLNVRQLAQYPPLGAVPAGFQLLVQNGIGGPYFSTTAATLVATALSAGGGSLGVGMAAPGDALGGIAFTSELVVGYDRGIYWNAYPTSAGATNYLTTGNAAALGFDPNLGWQFSYAPPAGAGSAVTDWLRQLTITPDGSLIVADQITVARDPAEPLEVATLGFVDAAIAELSNSVMHSFNGRSGNVILSLDDVLGAGAAPIWSPRFLGCPAADTPPPWSHSGLLATTAFVHRNSVGYINSLLQTHPFVFTFNGRTGNVTLTPDDIEGAEAALLNSPVFTGTPTTPTPAAGDNSLAVANTEFVTTAIAAHDAITAATYAPIDGPSFTGYATAPTAPPGSSTGQLATTAFVTAAVTAATAGVASFNTRTGAVTLDDTDITNAGGALLASPVFTGTPQAPQAPAGADTSQIATCAWVMNELGGVTTGVNSFNGRAGVVTLTLADVTGVGGAATASPIFTGTPTAPTAATGTSTQQLATTAFVAAAVTAGAGVVSFNGRAGAITLTANDISAAGGAPLASPALTGTPTAPTAAPATNNTQLATTAYVTAALAAVSRVTSFNGRSGVVTLSLADITGAGGAAASALAGYLPLSGGTLTGQLTGTTVAAGSPVGMVAEGLQTTQYLGINMNIGDSTGIIGGYYACLVSASANGLSLSSSTLPVTAGQTFAWALPVFIGAQGNVQAQFFNAIGTGYGYQNGAPIGFIFDGPSGNMNFYAGGAFVGYMTLNPPSDARLKERIEPSDVDGLAAILATPVRKFVWRADQRAVAIGLVAQELERTMPDMVGEADDTKTINHALAVPYLIRAVQQLEARVCDLEEGVKP